MEHFISIGKKIICMIFISSKNQKCNSLHMQASNLWHNKWNHCINEVLRLRFLMFTNLDNLRLLFLFQGQISVHLYCFTRPYHIKAFHTKRIYMCVGLKTHYVFINIASYIFVNTRFISSTDLIIMSLYYIKYCQQLYL